MQTSEGWLGWLEHTAVAMWMRDSTWAYPAVETAHIIGFTMLVGAAVVLDLRLLGLARSLPVAAITTHLTRWARRSLLLLVAPTGALLFMTQATETWVNPAFRLKLILLCAAGINALIFHLWSFKLVEARAEQSATPLRAKIAALLSLAIWTGVITCGRFIAYL